MAINICEAREKKASDYFGLLNMVSILIFNLPDRSKLIEMLRWLFRTSVRITPKACTPFSRALIPSQLTKLNHFQFLIASERYEPLPFPRTLRGSCGVIMGLLSMLSCLREEGGPQGESEDWKRPVAGAVRTHTAFIKFTVLCGHSSRPPPITTVTPKITDHRLPKQT